MSRIENALKKAQLLRGILDDKNRIFQQDVQAGQERGINVLIVSRDPRLSATINNIQTLLPSDIVTAGDVVKGLESMFEKSPQQINKQELQFTALMLDALCCNSSAM